MNAVFVGPPLICPAGESASFQAGLTPFEQLHHGTTLVSPAIPRRSTAKEATQAMPAHSRPPTFPGSLTRWGRHAGRIAEVGHFSSIIYPLVN